MDAVLAMHGFFAVLAQADLGALGGVFLGFAESIALALKLDDLGSVDEGVRACGALDNTAHIIEHQRPNAHRREAVNRTELCARIAARSSLSRADAATALDAVVSAIADALESGEAVNMRASAGSPPATVRHARAAIPAPANPSSSPSAPCRHSSPARLFATGSTASVASAAVPRSSPRGNRHQRACASFRPVCTDAQGSISGRCLD